jgi:hypothetical protein
MEYAEFGKVDSVAFFAPMALASHEMLENPTADERYHFGRIAEVTNNAAVARAQADTILQREPENLLGLLLSARAARMTGDDAGAKASTSASSRCSRRSSPPGARSTRCIAPRSIAPPTTPAGRPAHPFSAGYWDRPDRSNCRSRPTMVR